MEINGKTKLMGLIGNPVEHTLSPVIHNTIASCMNENMAYLPFPVKEDLEVAVKGAYALGVQGMNVTVPYKSDVISALVGTDEQAAKAWILMLKAKKLLQKNCVNSMQVRLVRSLLAQFVVAHILQVLPMNNFWH